MGSALTGTLIRRKILGGSFVSLSEHGTSQGLFPREREALGLRGLGGAFPAPRISWFRDSRGFEVGTRAPCGKELLVSHGTSRSHLRHEEPGGFPAPLDELPAELFPGMPGGRGRNLAPFCHIPCGIPALKALSRGCSCRPAPPRTRLPDAPCRICREQPLNPPPSSPRLRR